MMQGGTIAMASAALSILSEDVPAQVFRDFLTERLSTAIDEVIRTNGLT